MGEHDHDPLEAIRLVLAEDRSREREWLDLIGGLREGIGKIRDRMQDMERELEALRKAAERRAAAQEALLDVEKTKAEQAEATLRAAKVEAAERRTNLMRWGSIVGGGAAAVYAAIQAIAAALRGGAP